MRILIPLILMAFISPAHASKDRDVYLGPFRADVYYVTDGDTFFAQVPLWPNISVDVDVRINGVDTPESWRPKCDAEKEGGSRATEFLINLLGSQKRTAALGKPLATVVLRNVHLGVYSGRVIADVYHEGRSVSDAIIEGGYGRAYDGGKRDGWC